MNDLDQIQKANAKAAEADSFTDALKAGKYVLRHYSGLNYVGHSVHDSEGEANAHAIEIASHVGGRTELMFPLEQTEHA